MSVVFSILAAAVCLILIGFPMFKEVRSSAIEKVQTSKRDLSRNKEILMSTLGEIEFDYKMKKLSEDDYKELKGNYSAAVAGILKEQQMASVSAVSKKTKINKGIVDLEEIEKEIEAELQALE